MQIIALMTVKDEADIVADVLRAAAVWADRILVMDNGSTDGTWETVLALADELEPVQVWGRFLGTYRDGLRQWLYAEAVPDARPGDWWCRLDADEFYVDDPRTFLRAVEPRADHVFSASFQHYLTEDDHARLLRHGEGSWRDVRWFTCNHSEPRFVRHTSSTTWPAGAEWPLDLRRPARQRIRLHHYQYRSLGQTVHRAAVRSRDVDARIFRHEADDADAWYRVRGLTPPARPELRAARVVPVAQLTTSEDLPAAALRPPRLRGGVARRVKRLALRGWLFASRPVLRRIAST